VSRGSGRRNAPREGDGSGRFTKNGANGAATHAEQAQGPGVLVTRAPPPMPHVFASSGQPPRPAPAPSAPRPQPPVAPEPLPSPPADVPPLRAAAPEPAPEPPPPTPVAADASNVWRARVADRDKSVFGGVARPFPQGETMLVQAWLQNLRTRRFPPQSCTILIRCNLPEPSYDFYIAGEDVCGDHPDRELFMAIERLRRRPTVQESFVGRIQAIDLATGNPIDLGWGHLSLAPQMQGPAQAPWSAGGPPGGWPQQGAAGWPGAPSPGWGPPPGYGPPPGAYGGPQGGPPGGWGPWGPPPPWAWGPPPAAAPAPAAAPPPPPPNTSDPMALELYKLSLEGQRAGQEAYAKMLERLANQATMHAPAPVAAPVDADAAEDRFLARLDKYLAIGERLRPPAAEPSGSPVHVTTLADGTAIVSNKDGVNTELTNMLMGKSMLTDAIKNIGDRIAKAKLGAVAQGANASGVAAAAGRAPRPT